MSDKRLCEKKNISSAEAADIAERMFFETRLFLDRQRIILNTLPAEYNSLKREFSSKAYEIKYMQGNINEYLRIVSGKYSLSPTTVDLNEFTEKICREAVPYAEARNIDFDYRMKKKSVCVVADIVRLAESLSGLIKNAIDYAGENGTVTVKVKSTNILAKVIIKNSGEGMVEAVLEHCKEPFYSRSGRNTLGLGLTLASHFARSSGGRLTVESVPNEQTEVTLLLHIDSEFCLRDTSGNSMDRIISECARHYFI